MNLDASIRGLLSQIKQTYELILENQSPEKFDSMQDVLVQIAQVVQECAQFMSKYSETKSFCMSLGVDLLFLDDLIFFIGSRLKKNILSKTTTMVTNYNSKLDQLMQEL